MVVVEETAKVAYAYLLRNQEIVADVWLWNREVAPDDEWQDPANLPFRNMPVFMSEEPAPVVSEADLGCSWSTSEDGRVIATLEVDGQPFARLWPGAKPGESRLARAASRVALPLSS